MKLIPLLPVSGLLTFILLTSACQKPAEQSSSTGTAEVPRPAKIIPVIANGYNMIRSYPGTLEASHQSDLAFRVSGQVFELPVKAGERVNKGELLARLDDTDYRISVEDRKARYELARIKNEQAKKLLKQKLSSQIQFDQSVAELKSARAALDQAQANLEYTHLVAPFSGIIAKVDINNHQTVQAMQPVITLQNDNQLDIGFSVPETLISQLKRVNDPKVIRTLCGKVSFSAHPNRVFNACHKEHESLPDPVTRNYAALFTLDDISEVVLLPGMTATVEIDFSRFLPRDTTTGIFVPVEAVFEQDGKQWLWTVDKDSRANLNEIESGRIEGDLIEIIRGLDKQVQVIAAGVSYIREGMLVKAIAKERGL